MMATRFTLEEIKQAAAYNRETLERIKQNIRLDYEYLPVSRAFSKYSASALHSQVFSSTGFVAVFCKTASVPCPLPVSAKEPYSTTL